GPTRFAPRGRDRVTTSLAHARSTRPAHDPPARASLTERFRASANERRACVEPSALRGGTSVARRVGMPLVAALTRAVLVGVVACSLACGSEDPEDASLYANRPASGSTAGAAGAADGSGAKV